MGVGEAEFESLFFRTLQRMWYTAQRLKYLVPMTKLSQQMGSLKFGFLFIDFLKEEKELIRGFNCQDLKLNILLSIS